jgi:hypothetical protein
MKRSEGGGGSISITIAGDVSGQVAIGDTITQIHGPHAARSARKVKVLFLGVNPDYTGPLLLGEEIRRIEAEIRGSEWRDALELVSKWAVRPEDLQRVLLEHRPQILHFSGHGSPTGELLLEPELEESPVATRQWGGDLLAEGSLPAPVSTSALVRLLHTIKDDLRVIVLNACFSESQAEALTECVDCAIGMKAEVRDRAALVFSAAYYRAIGYGRSVQVAFELGVNAIELAGIREDTTPRLFTREKIDASKIILVGS